MKSVNTNSHIHSPYSFSAFKSINDIVDAAQRDCVKVLGINDFYSTKGYDEFGRLALDKKIYPLYNVEFVAFEPEYQKEKIRVNDPLNYGRVYFVGKGLDRVNGLSKLSNKHKETLKNTIDSQVVRIKMMIDKVNNLFGSNLVSYENILTNTAKDYVGERHVAKEIKRVYDANGMTESEIRNKLLKRGGSAYVEESEADFIKLEDCVEIIRSAGGIPCYPVLFDHGNNNFTEYESDLEKMYSSLSKMGVRHLDIMPDRNNTDQLNRLVDFFDKKGFYIMFGTEHNTDEMKPVKVSHKNGIELSPELVGISYKGCCSIAAWQAKYSEENINIGDEIIKSYT